MAGRARLCAGIVRVAIQIATRTKVRAVTLALASAGH